MAQRALLTVAATSAVVLTLLASGTLAYSQRDNTPECSTPAQSQNSDSILRAVVRAWRNNDYTLARATGAQLPDPGVRSRIEQLILFGEARFAIGQNDPAGAFHVLRKLLPGAKRALIMIALARQQTATTASRYELLETALSDTATLPDVERQYLTAVILPIALDLDCRRGLGLLDRAIHHEALPAAGLKRTTDVSAEAASRILVTGSQLLEIVRASQFSEVFVLGVPGLSPADVRDLVVEYHATLRCMHPTAHHWSPKNQAAGHHSIVVRRG